MAKPRQRASLRVELIAMLAIVLVMAVVSLSFAAEWLGQRRHDQQELERLQAHARGLAVLAARSFRGGDFEREGLEGLLADSATQLSVSFEVHRFPGASEEGERVTGFGVHAGFAELPAARPSASRVDESLVDRWNLLVIDEPIPTHDDQRLVLRLIAEHSPWARSHDWRETLIVALGVGLLLLVLGGLLLEHQVLRPMRALERAVAEIGRGGLDIEAPGEGPLELQELAAALNRMRVSLREQQATLASQAEQLQRSERLAALGRIAAGVAHEVGNPLAAIVGYTELLLGEPEQSEDSRDVLARMQGQAQRIQGIVGQLLDYARPIEKQTVAFAARRRAEEVLALLRADPRCAGVELLVEGPSELEVLADPNLVEQVLINLVLNAAAAARDGDNHAPRVTVRVRGLDDALAYDVEDNGPGVPDEVRARIFEPFFTTRGAGQGTGLGLAISQGLAESMDGKLECLTSSARGAVFRLSLPRA